MTVAAVALGTAAVVSAGAGVYSSMKSAEGAQDAQQTMQGGINRMEAFRNQLRQDSAAYRGWKEDLTGQMVEDAMKPAQDSQAYKDALRRFEASNLASGGSARSGAAMMGRRDLASAEGDAQFQRRAALAQLLGQETARSDQLSAGLLSDQKPLIGGLADAQQQEANAQAAGIEAVGGGISGALSGFAGAYGAYKAGQGQQMQQGGPTVFAPAQNNSSALLGGDIAPLDTSAGWDTSKLSVGNRLQNNAGDINIRSVGGQALTPYDLQMIEAARRRRGGL